MVNFHGYCLKRRMLNFLFNMAELEIVLRICIFADNSVRLFNIAFVKILQ